MFDQPISGKRNPRSPSKTCLTKIRATRLASIVAMEKSSKYTNLQFYRGEPNVPDNLSRRAFPSRRSECFLKKGAWREGRGGGGGGGTISESLREEMARFSVRPFGGAMRAHLRLTPAGSSLSRGSRRRPRRGLALPGISDIYNRETSRARASSPRIKRPDSRISGS